MREGPQRTNVNAICIVLVIVVTTLLLWLGLIYAVMKLVSALA